MTPWSEAIRARLRNPLALERNRATVNQPLLTEVMLAQIHAAATSPAAGSLRIFREVQHLLLGERSSAFAGSGYEFAGNRRYVAGDDVRYINWRLLARTGELYRKVFHEERRPQLWLLVDRRAGMRFGTRVRLKATQAAIAAAYHLYMAQQQQLPIGAVILDDDAKWFAPAQGRDAVQPLLQHLASPCPPTAKNRAPGLTGSKTFLAAAISRLRVRLAPGCIVVMISDFHDLSESMLGSLHALSERHTVSAWHIIDAIEETLPTAGRFPVHDPDQGRDLVLACDDVSFREQYTERMQARLRQVEDWLSGAGVQYQRCRADEDRFSQPVTGS